MESGTGMGSIRSIGDDRVGDAYQPKLKRYPIPHHISNFPIIGKFMECERDSRQLINKDPAPARSLFRLCDGVIY